jgi:hypothetical protein
MIWTVDFDAAHRHAGDGAYGRDETLPSPAWTPPLFVRQPLAFQPEDFVGRRERKGVCPGGGRCPSLYSPRRQRTAVAQTHDQFTSIVGKTPRDKADLNGATAGHGSIAVEQSGE